jgi:hypothetical protein
VESVVAPNFKLIEGGGRGPPKRDDLLFQQHLHAMLVEILRGIARGNDPQDRIATHFRALVALGPEVSSLSICIAEVLERINKDINPQDPSDEWRQDTDELVIRSLRLAAEESVNDDGAKGRASRRRSDVDRYIDHLIIGHESRARENGWSWIGRLLHVNFPPKRSAKRKRKAQSKDEPPIVL